MNNPESSPDQRFAEERRALREKWFGRDNFTAHFGPIRSGRVEDPHFIAKVREVFAEEVEHEITFPAARAQEHEFAYPDLIRSGQPLPRSGMLMDKLARIVRISDWEKNILS